MSTQPTDALELLREIYADLVQGAIPNADDPWWQKASAALAGTPTHAQAGAVTDAQVLAAVRVVSPGLFRHGLQPLSNDGANTAAQMRKEADTVRKMLEAANGIKGGQHGTE